MPFQKVEFEFPDPEKESAEIEIEPATDVTDITEKPNVKVEKQEIEVDVVDDTPAKDRNRTPSDPPAEVTEDELGDYSEKVKKRIQHFSKGYHDERRKAESAMREREEAVRLAQSLLEENNRLKEDTAKTRSALLEQAKLKNAQEIEKAKQDYQLAYESGDSKKLLDAQTTLNAAQIAADKLHSFRPQALQPEKNVVQTETNAPAVSVDQKAVSWQKQNPWFGTDDEMTSLALGLHQKLVREGIDPRSDDYYDRINGRMRQLFPDKFESEEAPPADRPRRSNVVAPASRSVAPRKITLTSSAVALAKRLGLTPEQYARELIKMENANG